MSRRFFAAALVLAALAPLALAAVEVVNPGTGANLVEVDPSGEASGLVAVGRGNSEGTLVAASAEGDASSTFVGLAPSGTARGYYLAASVTGTGHAQGTGVGASLAGAARGGNTFSAFGPSAGGIYALALFGDATTSYASVSVLGDSGGGNVAVSAFGDADTSYRTTGVAVAPFGNASGQSVAGVETAVGGCEVASALCLDPTPGEARVLTVAEVDVFGDAEASHLAASGFGDADGGPFVTAVSLFGNATGALAASLAGETNGAFVSVTPFGSTGPDNHGATVAGFGDASAHHAAVALWGDATAWGEGSSAIASIAPLGHASGGAVSVGGCDLVGDAC